MMSRAMTSMAAAVLMLAAASASAETGTRIDRSRLVENPVAGWAFGQCVARFRAEAVESFLRLRADVDGSRSAMEDLVDPNDDRCYSLAQIPAQQLVLEPEVFRGQLAQGRYLARYPEAPPALIADAQPGTIPVEVYNQRISTTSDVRSEVIRIFGDCVTAARPDAVDALVRTRVTSDEESAAIAALGENFGPCLWEGQSISFSRESLRAALADALYRKAEGRAVTELAANEVAE